MNTWLMLFFLIIAFSGFAFSLYQRIFPLFVMRFEIRWDNTGERIKKVLYYVLAQKRFWRKWEFTSGLSHIFIFWGFGIMSLRALTMFLMGLFENPDLHLPFFNGPLGKIYALCDSLFIMLVFVGVSIGLYRRLVLKPERLISSIEAYVILFTILVIVS